MINCKKSAELISKKKDRKLSLVEKINLKFHLLMCTACNFFETEVDVMSSVMESKKDTVHTLDQNKKEALQKAIDAQK